MKKRCFSILKIISVLCIVLVLFCSCYTIRERKYYSQKENFINVTGIVCHIKYNEDYTELYLGFKDLSVNLDDDTFEIVGKNLEITRENGIDSVLKMGDAVDFITAPRYFGDGYVMPIVGLSVNGQKLLDFEEGYSNFIEWLS